MPLPSRQNRGWPALVAETEVVRLWKQSGLRDASIARYRRYLGIFFAYCTERSLDPRSQLTERGAWRFCRWYQRRGRAGLDGRALFASIRSPLFSYRWAVSTCGHGIQGWKPAEAKPDAPAIVTAYTTYTREHRGLAPAGLIRDEAIVTAFLIHLRRRGQRWREVNIAEIDRYLMGLARKQAQTTVARSAYAIRSWLRFLHATNRLPHDLSAGVVAPVRQKYDRPPRARPWSEIKRILGAISQTTRLGLRDRAQLLLMSAYGLGGAEVIHLRVQDIDWRNQTLRVIRPKTKVAILLPLMPTVARALADYLRKARPLFAPSPYVFLSARRPFAPFNSTSVLRHRIRMLARRAGISAAVLGAHMFRHSHATRHLLIGTPMKTLGDILGHRDPETTSIYTRAAVQRLRRLALPVPI